MTRKGVSPVRKSNGVRMMNLYKALWLKLGSRPWTFILRDTWHKLEGLWIIGLVAIGALLGHWLWDLVLWLLLVFTLGYITGHLFWGKEYKPYQGKQKG